MSDDLVRRLACPYPKDEDVEEVTLPVWVILLTTEAADRIEELEGQLQSVLDRETSILRYYDAKLDAAEAKLAKAIEALDEAIYLLDPDEEDITKETGLYRIVKAFKELKGEQP
jgi:hypothetical protein